MTATLHLGDCLDILRTLPTASVDAVVTDPPYSSGGAFRGDRCGMSTTTKYVQTGQQLHYPNFAGDSRDQRGYLAWCAVWLAQCFRIAKPGAPVCVFSDWRQLPTTTDAIQAGGFVWRGIAVWSKPNARPCKGRFTSQAEYIAWGSKGSWGHKDGPCVPGVFACQPRAGGKHHIAGKPEAVMDWLLGVVPPGGVVLDPFMGSGSTGVAQRRRSLGFIGIECDPTYHAVAGGRIAEAEAATP